VRGRFFVFSVLAALAVALPAAGARHSTIHFKVVSAKATATLTFHTEKGDQSTVSDGKIGLVALGKGAGEGSLPGRALVPLKGKISERVKTRRRISDTSPYQEQTCTNAHKIAGRGGVTLRRAGSKVEVRWAFPQAKPSFCRGPRLGKSVTSLLKRLYPATVFSARVVTLVLAGSKKVETGSTTLTYRWRATIKLART
jgi:hypothetical protein